MHSLKHDPPEPSTGFGHVLKSFTKSFKSSTSTSGKKSVQINPLTIGGDPTQRGLLEKVSQGSAPSRTEHLLKLYESIGSYSVSSIPEIWYLVKDLLGSNNPDDTRVAALNMLILCIKLDESAISSTIMYYDDILRYCTFTPSGLDRHFNLFLKALTTLTINGTDIHLLATYEKKPLGKFLSQAMAIVESSLRSASHKNESTENIDETLCQILIYITDCIKFNSNSFESFEIIHFLSQVITFTKITTNTSILERCLFFIETLSLYGVFPMDQLTSVISTLATVYTSKAEEFQEFRHKVIRILDTLIQNSQTTIPTIFAICELIHQTHFVSEVNENVIVGCLEFLKLLIVQEIDGRALNKHRNDRLNMFLDTSMSHLLESWEKSSEIPSLVVKVALLNFFLEILNTSSDYYKIFGSMFWFNSDSSLWRCFDNLVNFSYGEDDDDADDYYRLVSSLLSVLQRLSETGKVLGMKDNCMNFFNNSFRRLSDSHATTVIEYYEKNLLCYEFNVDWEKNSVDILQRYFINKNLSLTTRLKAFMVVKDACTYTIQLKTENTFVSTYLYILFLKFEDDVSASDEKLKEKIIDCCIDLCREIDYDSFKELISNLTQRFEDTRDVRRRSITSLYSYTSGSQMSRFANPRLSDTASNEKSVYRSSKSIAMLIGKLFMVSTIKYRDNDKVLLLYDSLVKMATFGIKMKFYSTTLIILKVLIRVRSTTTYDLYFANPIETDGLADAMHRNISTDPTISESKSLKWVYPESDKLHYIPFDCLDKCVMCSKTSVSKDSSFVDVRKWFQIVLDILTNFYDWELYSYVLAHFCAQLSNLYLFDDSTKFIQDFRKIITDQLELKLPSSFNPPENVAKTDIQIASIRVLSALVAYHSCFSKQDQDQLVAALIHGLSSWEKTAIPCLHSLVICCYELPRSLKRYLSSILTALQTRISSTFAIAHILEFLISLCQLPKMSSEFSLLEFKRVFGVAFKFIEYAKDKFSNPDYSDESQPNQGGYAKYGQEIEFDKLPSTKSTAVTPQLLQYIMALSYNVITSWFLVIPLKERKFLSPFLIRNLLSSSVKSEDSDVSDEALATIDFVSRYTYSNMDLTWTGDKQDQKSTSDSDEEELFREASWISGISILTIRTNKVTGDSTITVRKPIGTTEFSVSVQGQLPTNIYKDDEENENLPKPANYTPNFLLLQFMHPLGTRVCNKPLPLSNDDSVKRSVDLFDKVPVVTALKAGIIYIGKGQSTEQQVLSNLLGSDGYHKFITEIGDVIKLKDSQPFYVGGLDTTNDIDGEFAISWGNQITRLIFHTTTLMPNNEDDPQCSMKKRHIGNNFVNIFYNDSESPFDFNLIKSQFNFINIVIQPHSRNLHKYESNHSENFYKIKMYRRAGLPGVFSTSHFKLISVSELPTFVRNTTIIASLFANVWNADDGYISNWAHRVSRITTIRDKSVVYHENLKEEQGENGSDWLENSQSRSHSNTVVAQSFLDQLSQLDISMVPSVPNSATSAEDKDEKKKRFKFQYVHENDSELYERMEFNSFTT
ncbi:hypothetical protein LJB42_004461 [Komagataella kurtzmanii]|nr:hypothetical protein LJB42_004461 [Komagataella kurtzmanii]